MPKKKRRLSLTPEAVRAQIKKQDSDLLKLVTQDTFSKRDTFIAREIVQQRIDTLKKMEKTPMNLDASVIIEIGGNKIRFENSSDFATFAAGVMYE